MNTCNSCNINEKPMAKSNTKHTCGSLRSEHNAGPSQPSSATGGQKATDVANSGHTCGDEMTVCDVLRSLFESQPRPYERQPSTKCSAPKPTQGEAKNASDVPNPRHVCGGKDGICEFLRSQTVAQPLPDKTEKTARDIANSKHVCGGKGSICEFLRSKPAQEPSCGNAAAKPKSPGPCGTAAKPESPVPCRDCARTEVPTSGCGSATKPKSPGPCATAAKPEFHPRPSITIGHLEIVIKLCGCGKAKQCRSAEPGINASGLKHDEHSPRTETGGFGCVCREKSNGTAGQFTCECFSAAEPYMLMGQVLAELEKKGGEQQQKKRSCLHHRRNRHSKTSISLKPPVEPTNAVVRHGSQESGAEKSNTMDRNNASSCNCCCHVYWSLNRRNPFSPSARVGARFVHSYRHTASRGCDRVRPRKVQPIIVYHIQISARSRVPRTGCLPHLYRKYPSIDYYSETTIRCIIASPSWALITFRIVYSWTLAICIVRRNNRDCEFDAFAYFFIIFPRYFVHGIGFGRNIIFVLSTIRIRNLILHIKAYFHESFVFMLTLMLLYS